MPINLKILSQPIFIFLLAVSLFSFNSVFAQSKKFLQKQPDFNAPLQKPGQLPDNALSQASGAIQVLREKQRENCIAAINDLTWSTRETLKDIGTLLGMPTAGVPFQVNPISMARLELEQYFGPDANPRQNLQAIAEEARSPINGRRALSLFRQQAEIFQQAGNMMREHQPQVVALDEQINQKLLQLTGKELANQFIEDSQGSCGLTPENSHWVGDP